MSAFNSISIEKLARLVGTPDCPQLIDIRIDEDFSSDPRMVPTSRRCPHLDMDNWSAGLSGRVVVICNKGLKLSEGVAALLRLKGIAAEVLEGGFVAWSQAGLPLLNIGSLPGMDSGRSSLWVTRHRPKIDRIACPWLIRRFVDPQARFLFVAPSEVLAVAENFGATAFDVADVFFTHRGDACTFDTMLAEFGLALPALVQMAAIIRGADTNRPELAPEAKGLLAISLGLSRMFADDLEQLEAGVLVYDALYRFVRDAGNETHDWVSHAPKAGTK